MFSCHDFTGHCTFCFRNVFNEPITYCECGTEFCNAHVKYHMENDHRRILVTITGKMPDIEIKIESSEREIEKESLESQIRQCLFTPVVEGAQIKKCPHINVDKEILIESATCTNCDINSNSWACVKCSTVFCGREQYGIEGKGHGMKHYMEDNEHCAYLKVQSIDSNKKIVDVYCYKCESMVGHDIYPYIRNLIPNANNSHNEKHKEDACNEEIAKTDAEPVLSTLELARRLNSKTEEISRDLEKESTTQIIPYKTVWSEGGIVDLGNTCYISSVLQAVAYCISAAGCMNMLKPIYYTECERPKECFGCQFRKVIKQVDLSHKTKVESFSVSSLCKVIESMYPRYVIGTQQDASEYLTDMLMLVESYSEMGHFSELHECFKIRQEIHIVCDSCNTFTSQEEVGPVIYIGSEQKVEEIFSPEMLPAVCECKERKKRKTYLTKPPKILTVGINKDVNSNEKRTIPDILNVKSLTEKNIQYRLEAAIIHKGTPQAGHYVVQVPLAECKLGKSLFQDFEKKEKELHAKLEEEVCAEKKEDDADASSASTNKKHRKCAPITQENAYVVHDNEKTGIQELLQSDATLLFYKLFNE
ncbi:ubiquitin carboxyl-terminal hydrolase 5/13 [Nematocida ausubeli]|nr:ubiquitin carboxyl-terminal hydrolase 5/13 [Nematocida ausubeli]